MVFTPVGIKCAETPACRPVRRKVVQGAAASASRAQGALLTKILIGINVAVFALSRSAAARSVSGRALHGSPICTGAERVPRRRRARRLVAARDVDVPPRQRDPPRDEHALPLVDRRAGRAGDRARALRARLRRGGLGGAAGALLFGKYELFGTSLATPTVGASGALFGILGAAFVFERQRQLRARRRRPHDHRAQPRVLVRDQRDLRSAVTSAGSSAGALARSRSRASVRRTPRTDGPGSRVSSASSPWGSAASRSRTGLSPDYTDADTVAHAPGCRRRPALVLAFPARPRPDRCSASSASRRASSS